MRHSFLTPLVVALTCAAFLFVQGGIAMGAETDWQTWPGPKTPPTTQPAPPAPAAPAPKGAPKTAPKGAPKAAAPATPAAKAGEKAGKKTAGGIKAGTIGWGLLIAAGIAGVAIAVGGGGGGTTSNH